MHADYGYAKHGYDVNFIAESGRETDFSENQKFLSDLNRVCKTHSFRNVLVAKLPTWGSVCQQAGIITSSFSKDIAASLYRLGEREWSYFVRRCEKSSVPFGWDVDELDVVEGKSSTSAPAMSDVKLSTLLSDQGIAGGYSIPVRCPFGQSAYALFFSDRVQRDNQYPEILLPVIGIVEQMVMRQHEQQKGMLELTGREIECLKWVAEGKTSSDVARIVGLSEHTINHYLLAATRKLDSVNRTQAIAKFIRCGFI